LRTCSNSPQPRRVTGRGWRANPSPPHEDRRAESRAWRVIDSPPNAAPVKAFGLSEIGPVRHTNEDRFVSAEDLHLYVVADGMGGHAAGEVAARLAVESIESFVRRSSRSAGAAWPYD